MAQKNWPYLLRILLKDGWTIEGLARAVCARPERVKEYLSGVKTPEPHTALEFSKIMRAHLRNGLQIVRTSDPPDIQPAPPLAVSPPERGVYELLASPGYRAFQSITDAGLLAVELRYHMSFEERDVVLGLRRWLDRGDPIIRLVSSDPTSS